MGVWLQACRVNSLAISTIGVMVGTAAAIQAGHFDLIGFLLAWLGAVMIQAGTNLINVYYNYKAVQASADPASFDPRSSSAVIRLGKLSPAQVRNAGVFSFAVGIACGLALTWICGWAILWLGLPAVIAGYSYAGPPLRYGYLGLGVVSVFLFMGPVMVCGAYFVIARSFSASALAAAIPIGLVAAGIMHTNDLRDYENDIGHGKKTVATLLGRRGAAYALATMDALAFLVIAGAFVAGILPWPVLLVLLAIPQAASQIRMVFRATDPKQLHEAWLGGVKLHMQFGLLMIAGLLAGAGMRR
jgi:1,4-dihydroxy-2-naphthoate octaprenyltransferase